MIAIALVLVTLAVELVLAAVVVGGLGWILLWPSASSLIVAFAYLTQSPVPFGKSGMKFHAGRRILLLPYLASVTLIWHVLRFFEREAPWNHLNRDFLVGRRLLPREYPAGVASVADLTCEFRGLVPTGKPVTYFSFPILDAGCPAPAELLSNVRAILELPRPVYLHCAQGRGRTGLVAAAILLADGRAKTVGEALAKASAARQGIRTNGRQQRVLEQFAQLLPVRDLKSIQRNGSLAAET